MIKTLTILFLLLSVIGHAQVYDGICAGGSQDEIGYDFIIHNDGSYTLLTSTRSVTAESEDIGLFQITPLKNFHWLKVYGSGKHEYPYSIIRTSDNGYLIAGSKWDGGYGRMDAYLLKLDAEFDIEWDKYYGGSQRDEGFKVIECSTGGYLICGMTKSLPFSDLSDLYLVRTDNLGNLLWEFSTGPHDSKDYLFDVIEDASGNFIAAGVEAGHYHYSTFDFSTSHSKSTLLKVNAIGNPVWKKNFDGPQNCWFKEIAAVADGSFYTIGSTQNNTNGSFDISLTKFNSQGDSLWQSNYGSTSFDYGKSILLSSDNYLYLAGSSCNDTINFTTDINVIKTDTSGNVIWDRVYGGNKSEVAFKIKETDAGVAILGSTKSFGNGELDAYLLELDRNGDVLHQGDDIPNYDAQLNIYPNPSAHGFNIIFNTDYDCETFTLTILDAQGKLVVVQDIINQDFNFIDTDNWGMGMYLYRFESDCFNTQVGKLIVH